MRGTRRPHVQAKADASRHRLDRGGNRQINAAIHRIAA
jgi:hypothetical protein